MKLLILLCLVLPLFASNGEKCALSEEAKTELDEVKSLVDQLEKMVALLLGPIDETPCQREFRLATEGPQLIGAYVPTCKDTGEYEVRQCHGSTGHCWCVDPQGQELEGTRRGPGEEVTCEVLVLDPCTYEVCDDLHCPVDVQVTYQGKCCPSCPEDYGVDPCVISGTCGILDPCAYETCDELPCPLDLQVTYPGDCCPSCPEDYGVDPCVISGTCVEITCRDIICEPIICPNGFELVTLPDECCPLCTEIFQVSSLNALLSGQIVKIGWTAPSTITDILHYTVRIFDPEEVMVVEDQVDPTLTTYTSIELEPMTAYNLTLVPVRTEGEGVPVYFAFVTDALPEIVEPAVPETVVYTDCAEAFDLGQTTTGVFTIQPEGSVDPFNVVCDMTSEGGKWTTILNRDGTADISFERTFDEYVAGFGDAEDEYFVGLENLYRLQKAGNTVVRFEMTDHEGETAIAEYSRFEIEDASTNYKLKVAAGFTGNAGNAFHFSKGMEFSSRDRDNDLEPFNCAVRVQGGGWHKSGICTRANIFGTYSASPITTANNGMYWASFKGGKYSLATLQMKVRVP